MVPSGVVADVFVQEAFNEGDFVVGDYRLVFLVGGGSPQREVPDKPLPVGPDVVVFGVLG